MSRELLLALFPEMEGASTLRVFALNTFISFALYVLLEAFDRVYFKDSIKFYCRFYSF